MSTKAIEKALRDMPCDCPALCRKHEARAHGSGDPRTALKDLLDMLREVSGTTHLSPRNGRALRTRRWRCDRHVSPKHRRKQ